MPDISTGENQRVLSAGMRSAAEMALPVNIAVFDTGANLKAFVRIDGALLGLAASRFTTPRAWPSGPWACQGDP
ncbi:heme-binding protein [Streptomyces himalayensis]|uniref:heme-binding protein n=1 Tax=Streptomyces himalayensis TaxID=2820085 RepID=UPI00215D6DF8|nr:heme-binding protein [Streptomyces himalayensis]